MLLKKRPSAVMSRPPTDKQVLIKKHITLWLRPHQSVGSKTIAAEPRAESERYSPNREIQPRTKSSNSCSVA